MGGGSGSSAYGDTGMGQAQMLRVNSVRKVSGSCSGQ